MTSAILAASEAEIRDAVLSAGQDGQPLQIVGGGTRLGLGRPTNASRTVSTAKHSGITLYEPGALTLVAKSGTPLKEIEDTLSAEGQRLAFEPVDHRALLKTQGVPTIGGTVAINNSGPRRIQAGACRDTLIGVRFIDGRGEVIKNGGRVMKNVTGYDLVKLMCGSYGTLGILSELSFKVLPANEREATVMMGNLSLPQSVDVMTRALGSPFEVTAASAFYDDAQRFVTALRVEGFERQVAYRLEKLRDLVGVDSTVLEGVAQDAVWQRVRDVEMFAETETAVWKISIKPNDAPGFIEGLGRDMDFAYSLDWGGGLVWLSVDDPATAGAETIRAHLARTGGHATLIRASDAVRSAVPVFQPQAQRLAKLSADLRSKFDPSGVLNPGRMAA